MTREAIVRSRGCVERVKLCGGADPVVDWQVRPLTPRPKQSAQKRQRAGLNYRRSRLSAASSARHRWASAQSMLSRGEREVLPLPPFFVAFIGTAVVGNLVIKNQIVFPGLSFVVVPKETAVVSKDFQPSTPWFIYNLKKSEQHP